ncbi:MAG: PAQR family membrane homeostasis protein TrhA [Erysipelotrichaceae bacterium]
MKKNSIASFKSLSFEEEVANSITHGAMAAALLLLLPAIAIYSYQLGGWPRGLGVGIFVISLFLMFITSCLYHSSVYGTKHKVIMRILDHCMIYVAIAGSYTPICISLIGGWLGIFVVIIQWLIVIVGILYKAIAQKAKPIVSIAVYLMMGWLAIFLVPTLLELGSVVFLILLILGGVFYSIGAIIYVQKRPWAHTIWHFFIIFAALSHLIGIIFFM